ncbi:MAG TPA: nitrite reductase large subunit NirB, partial [Puia sp.]|nr:nitrite reductase large subunit NirB [Puia sp.]
MRIVIIGNGMVGYKFCEKLLTSNLPGLHLTVFGEETLPAYDRVHLSEYFAGSSAYDLSMAPLAWYADNHIDLHLGDPVHHIDRDKKEVHSFKGLTIPYDHLVLATGSAAYVPPISGTDKDGVFVYRTIEDLNLIRRHASRTKIAAVIGGGLLGLEACKAMIDLGIPKTHVIEFAPRLMPRQIDDNGSRILQYKLEELDITVHTSRNTAAILGNTSITGLIFTDGTILQTDMLVISAGIRPRDELARDCGLETGHRGGIVVNEKMQTSDPHIYAIGECALYNGAVYGLVAPGYEMAEVAVAQLTAQQRSFTGFDMSTRLKLIGVDVASFGDPFSSDAGSRSMVFEDTRKGVYKRINLTADGRLLLGGILVGDASAYNLLLQTHKNNVPLPADPSVLFFPPSEGKKDTATGLAALPDEALICSCEGVSKGRICQAVTMDDCETLDALKKNSKAGTGCGGCVPMMKDLMHLAMRQKGKFVRNMICEHFACSRQELYDLVKIHDLRTFQSVLTQLGKGDGCEVCKPLVSSLIASLWNEMILLKGNDTAQDSNDRFLANIQRGGTYSVVPRIPGGEITPEKLIAIGQVAQKYGLYTKITGAQRIDMFGAHVSDLPEIWRELIDAGFESGHAYGKALRTVKSCVGSTWCRFGLHDSVSYAIRIEERYRGLRAPHKIKSAVSGCIRECAEAQSK